MRRQRNGIKEQRLRPKKRLGFTAPTLANNNDWRNELSQESRQKIVNKIMDTLQRHMPFSGPDGMHELKKISLRFEEKIYQAAVNLPDYLRKISLKMLSLRNHVSGNGNSLAGGSSNSYQIPMVPEASQSYNNQNNVEVIQKRLQQTRLED